MLLTPLQERQLGDTMRQRLLIVTMKGRGKPYSMPNTATLAPTAAASVTRGGLEGPAVSSETSRGIWRTMSYPIST